MLPQCGHETVTFCDIFGLQPIAKFRHIMPEYNINMPKRKIASIGFVGISQQIRVHEKRTRSADWNPNQSSA